MPHFRIPPVTVHATLSGVTTPELTPWGVAHVHAPEAWLQTQGEGTVAYVIDTGCWQTHPDLTPNLILPVRNFADAEDPANRGAQSIWEPVPDSDTGDGNGHATHICGTIAAADNGIGVRGVAPRAGLIAAKGIPLSGIAMDFNLTLALHDAAEEREMYNRGQGGHPVVVVNCSWGGSSYVQTMADAIARCKAAGIVVVAAAGNEGEGTNTVCYPGRDPNVLAVAATNDQDQRAEFSSTGPAVLFSAPGAGITSTYLSNGWATLSGTSMAAPHISGMVCLIQSLARKILGKFLSPDDVLAMLKGWARDLGAPGRDPQYGYGLPVWVDAPVGPPTPPVEDVYDYYINDPHVYRPDGTVIRRIPAPPILHKPTSGLQEPAYTMLWIRAFEDAGALVEWDESATSPTGYRRRIRVRWPR